MAQTNGCNPSFVRPTSRRRRNRRARSRKRPGAGTGLRSREASGQGAREPQSRARPGRKGKSCAHGLDEGLASLADEPGDDITFGRRRDVDQWSTGPTALGCDLQAEASSTGSRRTQGEEGSEVARSCDSDIHHSARPRCPGGGLQRLEPPVVPRRSRPRSSRPRRRGLPRLLSPRYSGTGRALAGNDERARAEQFAEAPGGEATAPGPDVPAIRARP